MRRRIEDDRQRCALRATYIALESPRLALSIFEQIYIVYIYLASKSRMRDVTREEASGSAWRKTRYLNRELFVLSRDTRALSHVGGGGGKGGTRSSLVLLITDLDARYNQPSLSTRKKPRVKFEFQHFVNMYVYM